MLARVVDIRCWLESDRDTPFAARLARDRAIGRSLPAGDDCARILGWWQMLQASIATESTAAPASLPGARVVRLLWATLASLIAIGVLLGLIFLAGGLVVREIPPIADRITRVLEYTNYGPLGLIVLIALLNAVAEELFFRGALYTALGRFYPVLISTLLYAVSTSASGNPMLGFAALILGTVCALERRATGGVLAPVLTHLVWGSMMVLALPPIFGL